MLVHVLGLTVEGSNHRPGVANFLEGQIRQVGAPILVTRSAAPWILMPCQFPFQRKPEGRNCVHVVRPSVWGARPTVILSSVAVKNCDGHGFTARGEKPPGHLVH